MFYFWIDQMIYTIDVIYDVHGICVVGQFGLFGQDIYLTKGKQNSTKAAHVYTHTVIVVDANKNCC